MSEMRETSVNGISGLNLLWLVVGFAVWSSAFVLLYALHALGCRWGWEETQVLGAVSLNRLILLAVYVVHIAAGAALWFLLRSAAREWPGRTGGFLRKAASLVTIAAALSTAWTGAPVLFLSACAGGAVSG